jgi:hypothetical protein
MTTTSILPNVTTGDAEEHLAARRHRVVSRKPRWVHDVSTGLNTLAFECECGCWIEAPTD